MAGNASATGTCTVKIDTRAPATTATGLQADNHSGWRNAPQNVTLAPDDGTGSGATATYYTLDGGARQTYSDSVCRVDAGYPHDRLLVGRRRRQHRGAATPAT